VKDTRTK